MRGKGKDVGFSWIDGRSPTPLCHWYVWCMHVKTCVHRQLCRHQRGTRDILSISVFSQLSEQQSLSQRVSGEPEGDKPESPMKQPPFGLGGLPFGSPPGFGGAPGFGGGPQGPPFGGPQDGGLPGFGGPPGFGNRGFDNPFGRGGRGGGGPGPRGGWRGRGGPPDGGSPFGRGGGGPPDFRGRGGPRGGRGGFGGPPGGIQAMMWLVLEVCLRK